MIIGIGIDIVKIAKMEEVLTKWKHRFTNRIFTEGERDYCVNRRLPSQHFAARFAAKEAFLKALGAGMGAGIPWKDIEIITNPAGSPSLELHGKARESSCNKGVKKILVSLSHDDEHGVAEVVLEG